MTDETHKTFEDMIDEINTLDELDTVRNLLDARADEIEDLESDTDEFSNEDDE